MSRIDVLSVGDIVTDAFIKLLDDKAHTYDNEHGKWLAMPFGLKVPFDHSQVIEAVGNAANAAVSFARLGLESGLVTNVGGDKHGRDMIAALNHRDIETKYINIHRKKISNYHFVLWYKEERTILIKHEEYDYDWPNIGKNDIPKWIYFSSISENALEYHDEMAEWLEHHPEIKLAFQPGTFQMQAGVEKLKKIYKLTDVLILNREEAVIVGGGDHDNVHGLLDRLHLLGPKTVIITDGHGGLYASDGTQRLFMPIYPDPAPPFERTGAGDACASTIVAALMKDKPLEEAITWGPINSMSVVQHVGAQEGLLTEHKIVELLNNAPDWYHPKPM